MDYYGKPVEHGGDSSDDSEVPDDEDYIINHTLIHKPNSNLESLLPTPASQKGVKHKKLINYRKKLTYLLIFIPISIAFFIWISHKTHPIQSFTLNHINKTVIFNSSPNGLSRISLSNALSSTFYVHRHSISWLDEAGDGVYSEITSDGIILKDLKNNSTRPLIKSSDLLDVSASSIRFCNYFHTHTHPVTSQPAGSSPRLSWGFHRIIRSQIHPRLH